MINNYILLHFYRNELGLRAPLVTDARLRLWNCCKNTLYQRTGHFPRVKYNIDWNDFLLYIVDNVFMKIIFTGANIWCQNRFSMQCLQKWRLAMSTTQKIEAQPNPRLIRPHLPFYVLNPKLLDTSKVIYHRLSLVFIEELTFCWSFKLYRSSMWHVIQRTLLLVTTFITD